MIDLYCASMGKIFRVTHVCRDADEANRVMEKNDRVTLIAEDKAGLCYLAEKYGAVCPSAIMADVMSEADRRNRS